MKTEYVFSVDIAELVYSRRASGNYVYIVNHRDEMGIQQLCSVVVAENITAEREFMNHFGDDSSWPDGWWMRLMRDKYTKLRTKPMEFTRESWKRENYSPAPRSWQEYFGVPCRDDIGPMLAKAKDEKNRWGGL